MGREYHNKCRDYDQLKADFTMITSQKNDANMLVEQKEVEMQS